MSQDLQWVQGVNWTHNKIHSVVRPSVRSYVCNFGNRKQVMEILWELTSQFYLGHWHSSSRRWQLPAGGQPEYEHQSVNTRVWTPECEPQSMNTSVNTRVWTPECDSQSMNTRIWTPECEHQSVNTRVWQPEYEHQSMNTRVWTPEYEHQIVTTRLWTPECEH